MQKDNVKTKVIFRKFKEGEVIAIFPELPGNDYTTCLDYMHIGQHGCSTYPLNGITVPAKPEEYADLFKELEEIGYSLQVVKRISRVMIYNRRLAYYS